MPRGDGTGPDGTYKNCMSVDEEGNTIQYVRGRRRGRWAQDYNSGSLRGQGERGFRHRGPPGLGLGIGRGGTPRGGGLGLNARLRQNPNGIEKKVEE